MRDSLNAFGCSFINDGTCKVAKVSNIALFGFDIISMKSLISEQARASLDELTGGRAFGPDIQITLTIAGASASRSADAEENEIFFHPSRQQPSDSFGKTIFSPSLPKMLKCTCRTREAVATNLWMCDGDISNICTLTWEEASRPLVALLQSKVACFPMPNTTVYLMVSKYISKHCRTLCRLMAIEVN